MAKFLSLQVEVYLHGGDAKEKLDAGAALVQVWTGFIYEGPGIVKRICKEIAETMRQWTTLVFNINKEWNIYLPVKVLSVLLSSSFWK